MQKINTFFVNIDVKEYKHTFLSSYMYILSYLEFERELHSVKNLKHNKSKTFVLYDTIDVTKEQNSISSNLVLLWNAHLQKEQYVFAPHLFHIIFEQYYPIQTRNDNFKIPNRYQTESECKHNIQDLIFKATSRYKNVKN